MSNILNTVLERAVYPRVKSRSPTAGPGMYDLYEWYCSEIKKGVIKDSVLIDELETGEYNTLTFTKFYKVVQNNQVLWVVIECYIGSCYGCVDFDSEKDLNDTLDEMLRKAYISNNREEVEAYYQSKVEAHNLELKKKRSVMLKDPEKLKKNVTTWTELEGYQKKRELPNGPENIILSGLII